MLTEKDYCDYETCVALKELGYKIPTSAYYMPHHKELIWVSNPYRGGYVIDCFYSHNSLHKDVITANFIDAPTILEAQKWLREEKDISVEPCATPYNCWYYMIKCKGEIKVTYTNNKYKTYELAALAGIEYCLDNLIQL